MIIKTRGIVFGTRKYGEARLIVEIYTEERGLQSYIVNGVRSKKARVSSSLLQLLSLVEMVAYARDDRSLHRVREIKAAHVYHSIPFDLRKGAVGLFIVEVARKAIREVEENRPLFDFLYAFLRYLDDTPEPVVNAHLHFLCRLSTYLGFQPMGEARAQTPYFDLQEGQFVSDPPAHPHYLGEEMSRLVDGFLQSSAEECARIALTRDMRKLLVRHLLDFYRLHLEHFPEIRSHKILEEVLERH